MDTSLPPRPRSGGKGNYFGKQLLALKLFGVSLSGNESMAYKIYSFVFVFATIFLYTILDFYEYFKHDVSAVADIIVYQMGGFLSFWKVAVVFRNRVSFVKLLVKLEQEPFLPNPKRGGDEEEELIKECVWITNVQTYAYWITASVTVMGTILYSFKKRLTSSDSHDWQFPYGPFTVLNVTYSPNYEISYFYQSISLAYITCLFTSIDLLLAAVLAHISYQFKILQNNIRCVVEISHEDMMKDTSEMNVKSLRNPNTSYEIDSSVIPWIYLKNSLKRAIEYHLAIIDIATEIEKVFSDLLLLVFLGTLALICFSVYGASAAGQSPTLIARHVGEGVCFILQAGTICYWGEQVIQESQLVAKAAYESNFVGSDLRFQKMLAFIIRRSQNPTKVTAGKFADICLSTFTWILRTSYSSFMVLRQANENKT